MLGCLWGQDSVCFSVFVGLVFGVVVGFACCTPGLGRVPVVLGLAWLWCQTGWWGPGVGFWWFGRGPWGWVFLVVLVVLVASLGVSGRGDPLGPGL